MYSRLDTGDFQRGWEAHAEVVAEELSAENARGYRQGHAAGRAGPTWMNLAVVATLAFICGFCVAIGAFA